MTLLASLPFTAFLLLGTLLMALVMLPAARWRGLPLWKAILLTVLLTVFGVLGARIMAWVETGIWSGRSFFGAVFLPPLLMWPVARLIHTDYGLVMDLCAPGECMMLALLKLKCYIDGCCYGMVLKVSRQGITRFPSQLVELGAALVLAAVLMVLIRRNHQPGRVYAWYLLLYGITRFGLNLLRETTPFVWILPAGNFWSLVAILMGAGALIYTRRRQKQVSAVEKVKFGL